MQSGKLDVRTFSCCCKGCLHGDEDCSNVVCPDEWKEYNFTNKKFGKANRKWWLDTCNDQIHKIQENSASEQNPNIQQDVDWAGIVACMSALTTYDQLVQYVNNHPLPEFTDEPNDAIAQEEIYNLNMVALHHIPHDAPHRVAPISVEGDGNCFPRTDSYLLY